MTYLMLRSPAHHKLGVCFDQLWAFASNPLINVALPIIRRGFSISPWPENGQKLAKLGDLDSMDLKDTCLIYLLWPGCLVRDRMDLREWVKRKEIDFHMVHSSGHASSAAIYRRTQAVAPYALHLAASKIVFITEAAKISISRTT